MVEVMVNCVSSVKRRDLEVRECAIQPKAHHDCSRKSCAVAESLRLNEGTRLFALCCLWQQQQQQQQQSLFSFSGVCATSRRSRGDLGVGNCRLEFNLP